MANPSLHPRRGEIWWVQFEPVVGSEIGKERPAVVVQGDDLGRLPVRVVVPITGWDARYEEHVWLTELVPDAASGLTKPSGADALQIRTVSIQRLGSVWANCHRPLWTRSPIALPFVSERQSDSRRHGRPDAH